MWCKTGVFTCWLYREKQVFSPVAFFEKNSEYLMPLNIHIPTSIYMINFSLNCFIFSNFWIVIDTLHKIDFRYFMILIFLVIILTVALSLAIGIIRNKTELHKNEMNNFKQIVVREMQRFAKSESAGVAKNLHDDVSMPLSVVKFNLAKILKNNGNKELSEKLITDSLNLLDESIEHIRGAAKKLSPPTLMKLGYTKGISELCNQIKNSSRIRVELITSKNEVRLPHSIELELYRITQEVLNNIVKHSRVVEINVSIDSDEKELRTIVSYNGFGLDSKMADELSETDKGVGLKSIQDRAEMIGAKVQYDKIACNQYKTTIEVPVYEKAN